MDGLTDVPDVVAAAAVVPLAAPAPTNQSPNTSQTQTNPSPSQAAQAKTTANNTDASAETNPPHHPFSAAVVPTGGYLSSPHMNPLTTTQLPPYAFNCSIPIGSPAPPPYSMLYPTHSSTHIPHQHHQQQHHNYHHQSSRSDYELTSADEGASSSISCAVVMAVFFIGLIIIEILSSMF